MWLYARRHDGLASYFECRAPLIRSERLDQFLHDPLADFLFLELDYKGNSNCSVVDQFHNVFSTMSPPCRSYRHPLNIGQASIAHQCLDLPWFRQFKHRWRRWQVDVHVCDRRNGLED